MRLVAAGCLLLLACRPPGYGRDDGAGDDDGATVDAPPVDGPALDAAAAACDHGFRLDGRGTAASVWLTGSFLAWPASPAAGAIPFALGLDGGWTVSHAFAAGRHEYKFIVDGAQWIADPTNPDVVDDGFGGSNSVYVCAP